MTGSLAHQPVPAVQEHLFDASVLERIFNDSFLVRNHTRLVGGAAEPLYSPASSSGDEHCIHYREDYFASALHEVAHWCIAGPERRKKEDFGYWYAPDGRSAAQQQAFERFEYRNQALELLFCRACGFPFSISVDNIEGDREPDTAPFRRAVYTQARRWQQTGLPERAGEFFRALAAAFDTGAVLAELDLSDATPDS